MEGPSLAATDSSHIHVAFQHNPSSEPRLDITNHDFLATSEGHDLNEQILGNYPMSTYLSPVFSPSLEYRGPDESLPISQKSTVRPLAPRKGSPRRETHIPRPRNPFMIFRSEYHAQSKITTDVERDHRHISRIVGHLWNNMSEEDKSPYRAMAEKERLEHQRKYPGYRFSPGTRTSKPVKRNVKRNSQRDLARSHRVAELLKAGIEGRELESALKEVNLESIEAFSPTPESSSPSPSPSPAAASPLASHDAGGKPLTGHKSSEAGSSIFRSPLLAPRPMPTAHTHSRQSERPVLLAPDPSSIFDRDGFSPQRLAYPTALPPASFQMPDWSIRQSHQSHSPSPYIIYDRQPRLELGQPGALSKPSTTQTQTVDHYTNDVVPGLFSLNMPLDSTLHDVQDLSLPGPSHTSSEELYNFFDFAKSTDSALDLDLNQDLDPAEQIWESLQEQYLQI
ncbi:hypothetical protein D9757_002113 [Collybiopsis confluens]|uniref:HMG box domain-containing protein n=1 Tax=Collybiopsis confluens TaxID=2823264 RepID=A0A8H5I011_9AGAR|nr:hypothetical protein D9757_002113 [Collybiopsis confluens]